MNTTIIDWTKLIKGKLGMSRDNESKYHVKSQYATMMYRLFNDVRILDKDFYRPEWKDRLISLKPVTFDGVDWNVWSYNSVTGKCQTSVVTECYMYDRFNGLYADLVKGCYDEDIVAIVLSYFSDKEYLKETLVLSHDASDEFQGALILRLIANNATLLAAALTNLKYGQDTVNHPETFLNIYSGDGKRNYLVDTCQPCDGQHWDKVFIDDPYLSVLLGAHGINHQAPHLYIRPV